MSKFHGAIGFATQVEETPGVWVDKIVERTYRGDILQNYRHWQDGYVRQDSQEINNALKITNQISIIADLYAYENIPYMRYVVWLGSKWFVDKLDVNRPRIILTIGEVYNGETA